MGSSTLSGASKNLAVTMSSLVEEDTKGRRLACRDAHTPYEAEQKGAADGVPSLKALESQACEHPAACARGGEGRGGEATCHRGGDCILAIWEEILST